MLAHPRRLQQITILGATGSIGGSTLDVVHRHRQRYAVFALTASTQVDRLAGLCQRFNPKYAVMADTASAERLRRILHEAGNQTEVLAGAEALAEVSSATEVDIVMSAIVGAAGLKPTLAAVRAGKKVLLANKETLVMSGALFMDEVAKSGAVLLPIDSEHNAVFQALPHDYQSNPDAAGVRRILLTASGGPFRNTPLDQLEQVTPEQACAHPTWQMGKKISVDSATMMNKGLEVIEAHWLFAVPPQRIEVIVHPQSVIHSMVDYVDGSVVAQLGYPDMRIPIAHALAWPERIASGVSALDLFDIGTVSFERPSFERFPCLGLAYQSLQRGGLAPAVLNAANEEAVAAFLGRKLGFRAITEVITATLARADTSAPATSIEGVLDADAGARRIAREEIDRIFARRQVS
ncbi:1-deoxy-D-xylulose 5-phosphate reductoisomerase [Betaproteobacteria bacterium]|nr:1-deoxy-D-xylulose 5-phosphate reductoisomerase [Betaproteobacteria bacterium]GHU27380.1 1-deoxy-D-xylulose 5-phosphate reductoisomerase [Betaproteobacteria bacterium]